jgi:transcription-repair coupling factor (superfamily II helicase)
VRLEWFGDEIEQIREFDPATQRSALDKVEKVTLTPTSFAPIINTALTENVETFHEPSLQELGTLEGSRRFLGLAFAKPASLLDYLAENTLVAIDEP